MLVLPGSCGGEGDVSLGFAAWAAVQPVPGAYEFQVAAEFAERVMAGRVASSGLEEADQPPIVTGRERKVVDPAAYLKQRSGCAANGFRRVGDRNEIGIEWTCGIEQRRIVDAVRVDGGKAIRVDADVPVVLVTRPMVARGPTPRPINANLWVTPADYPAEALRAGAQGTTGFRLTVSPQGRVTDCAITRSSGSAVLDSSTCRLVVSRGRFQPARNANGEAIASTFTSTINWRVPPARARTPGLMAVRYDISPTGEVSNCRAEARGTVPEQARASACAAATTNPPAAVIAVAAPTYKSLAFVTSVSEGTQQFPINSADWGTLLSRRSARMTYSAAGKPLRCVPEASFGPGGDMCRRFPAPTAGTNTLEAGARTILTEVAIFGLPR